MAALTTPSREELEKSLEAVLTLCPFKERQEPILEQFDVRPDEESEGWYFECHACRGAKCHGYVRKGSESE